MSKLTTRITALLLSGMLAIGSVPGSVLAASTDLDPGQTSEIAQEVYEEESSEAPADAGETTQVEDTSEESAGTGETAQVEDTSEEPTAAGETAEEASAEEEAAVQYYTVTLNANGGYFENEWDDAVGDYTQQSEVVEKHIPVDGTVAAFPVHINPDGQSMLFAGWSLERDGELVITGDEEYAPVDNCVLYAVWEAAEEEDAGLADTEQETEAVEETESAQEYADTEVAEDTDAAQETAEDEYAAPETDNEQDTTPAKEDIYADEKEEETSEEAVDASVVESSDEEETVREDAANGVVESGTCGENLTWTLDDEGTLTISGTGAMEDYSDVSANYIFKNYTVRKVIIEFGVTSIGKYAFCECSSLTSITIPNSVTSIGSSAFSHCTNMKSVKIPNSVTSIGFGAFGNCESLVNVTVPNSVTNIGQWAFAMCRGLKSVTISNSVTSIEGCTFNGCISLKSVTIPNGVKIIKGAAFSGCSSLMSVSIPNTVTSIEGSAFCDCSSLTSVTIPDSVTSIGESGAFSRCTSLSSIYFKGNAPTIGSTAFRNVTATAYYPANDPTWTEDVRQNYGGNITWVEDDSWHLITPYEVPQDTWGFGNYGVERIPLLQKEYTALTSGMDKPLKAYVDKLVNSPRRGQCYGLCVSSILEGKDVLPLEEIDPNASQLVDVLDTPKAKSIIGYYYLNQFTSTQVENLKFQNKSVLQQLNEIHNSNLPMVLEFGSEKKKAEDSWAHAIVGYKKESGLWNIYHDSDNNVLYGTNSGKTYNNRILTYDCNYRSGNFFSQDSYFYYNDVTGEWEVPNYPDGNSSKGYLKRICSDLNVLKSVNANAFAGLGTSIRVQNYPKETNLAIETTTNSYSVNGEIVEDGIVSFYDSDDLNGEDTAALNICIDEIEDISIIPAEKSPLDLMMTNQDYFYGTNFESCESVSFDTSGGISANGVEGEYSVTITSKEDDTVNPFYTYVVEGNDSGNISANIQEDGLHVIGENLEDVTITGENDTDTDELKISTDSEEVLITGDENGLKGLIDTNNDGVFDKYLSKGCEITKTSVSSIANSNGIEIELDQDSYTLQEGDTLTIDATIKTDKEQIENQNEYVGCFAYYANQQWNNLALWDIEGGTTLFSISQTKSDWEEYGDVMFSISVFPKDSISQGSVLVNKEFFVNIKQREFVITLDPNGGSISKNTVLVKKGDSIGEIPVPALEGYLFEGWYTDINGGDQITSNSVVSDDSVAILYAHWKKCPTISESEINCIRENEYCGKAIVPDVEVKYADETLTEGVDYTIEFSNNTNAGTATITISGKGDYIGTKTATFIINPKSLNAATVSGISNKTYTGSALTQNPTVKVGDQTLTKDTDYTVSYANNTKVGTATVKITGKGNYTGTVSKTFKINGIPVSNAAVSGISNKTYTGSAITQNPTVKVGDKTLKKGTDYTISYANNTNVGTATVTITGKGNYASKKTATFKINKAAQSITAKAKASRVAVGKTTTVSITGNKGKKSYKSSNTAIATVDSSTGKVTAKKVGTIKITATSAATSNYNAASKTVTIKIVPAATASLTAANQVKGIKLTWKKVTGANGYKIYRGSTLIKTITSGSTVTFADTKANTNGTKYTYKVIAKATTGDSTLSRSRVIYRVSRPAVSSVTNSASKKMTVKWGKNAKANGYQIQYSTDKTFKTGNKAVSITSASTVSRVIGSLTKGKTYYVRIRTYKTVGSTKYWSIWSAARSVKISK